MLTVGGSDNPPFTDTMFGREFFFPVTTTVILSLVAGAIAKFI